MSDGPRGQADAGAAFQGASGRATRQGPQLVPFEGLRRCAPLARFSLRGDLSDLASALMPAGVPVSQAVCRAVAGEGCIALWLGPDEQLLLAEEASGPRLAQVLGERLAAVPHSLVDISQRQVAFEIVGPAARTLLATGCPLDLADEAFPVGMCTRTLFAKSEVVLWRCDPGSFHVEVLRSFVPYVTGLLAQAARELG